MTSESRVPVNTEGGPALPDPASRTVMMSCEGEGPWFAWPHPAITSVESAASRPSVFDFFVTVALLEGKNPRRNENQQLAAVVVHAVTPEQPAKQRDPRQARRGVLVGLFAADIDAADHRRVAVADEHLGDRALRVDRGNVVDGLAEVGRRVLQRDAHDDGVGR